LGKRFVYGLEVFQGYQKTLDIKAFKYLKEGKVEGNKRIYEGGKGRCVM
jgi:hypothetical protein